MMLKRTPVPRTAEGLLHARHICSIVTVIRVLPAQHCALERSCWSGQYSRLKKWMHLDGVGSSLALLEGSPWHELLDNPVPAASP